MHSTRILIADDHEVIRRLLRNLMESHTGWQVCAVVPDGKQAVEKATELQPDIAVLDVSMPEMDGLQATRLIRQKAPGCHVLVISQNDPGLMEKVALQAGAKGFIPKSKVSQELVKAIEFLVPDSARIPGVAVEDTNADTVSPDNKKISASLFKGEGEMARIMRSTDWAKTPLGLPESWSPALRMMVNFLLPNRFPQLLWWGPEFCCLYNDAYIPILGEKHPRAIGRPVAEVWNEIWGVLRPLIETPFHGGPATWMEDIELILNRRGFDEETHFTIAYSPVPDETVASGIGGVLATVNEITEKVIGERRIIALRELSAESIETRSADDACANAARVLSRHTKDVPFILLYLFDANGQTAQLAGATGADVDDPAFKAVGHFDAGDNANIWPVAEMVKTEAIHVIDLEGKFKTPPTSAWSDPTNRAAIVPLRSNLAHQLAGFMIVGISPRLKFDDGYRNFFELMSTQVATTIANARAYEEERKRSEALAEIDRAKTAFFSNVSHEFRTPLTLMMGPLEDLLADPGKISPASLERVNLAHRNSLRLLKLVNTLLDFSRFEAGRIQAAYQPTDLAAVTSELAGMFRSAVERAGLRLIVNCPAIPEAMYIDHEMWEKIVFNLLSNAFKFTLKGEIEVTLARVGPNAELAVRDSGTGIPEDEIPRLFERFHRVKGAQGRSYEGSGIGLALVQELAKLHGGSVRVESKMGQGSKFIVSIPLGKDHLPADRISRPSTPASAGSRAEAYIQELMRWLPEMADDKQDRRERDEQVAHPSDASSLLPPIQAAEVEETGERARILLIDDNADMRDYVERILRRHYDVTALSDGEAALKHALAHRPDIILSDIMMPKLDGFGVLGQVRANAALKDIPVILLSARAGEESRIEGLSSGADDYLVKPFTARELLSRVRIHLQTAHLRRKAQKELRASEERLRALVNASSYAVYRMSSDWSEMLELKGNGFIDDTAKPRKEWLQLYIHPDDQQHVIQTVHTAIRNKSVFELEHRVLRPDGSLGWTLSRAVPILDGDGNIVEWFGAASDVTRRKEVEQDYRTLAESLDAQVRKRTRELEDRNLDVIQQSEMLSEFSRRLMHIQDQERRRIARELHDSAGQTLALLGMNLAQLVQKAADSPALASEAANAEELVRQLQSEIRTTSYLLHPPLLDESGLPSALSWYIQGISERSGIGITLDIPEDFDRLPRDMELLVFRLVQECLTNIHRHANSKTAAINIARNSNGVHIEIKDQGKGITPERLAQIQSQNSGVGIRGMRERLRQFRGEMAIHSNGDGTAVSITIPLPADVESLMPVQSRSVV